jgi:tripartite-type tricarboxylate transporter receptor subunit TctC
LGRHFRPERHAQGHHRKLAAALDKALDDPGVVKRLADVGGAIPTKPERKPESFSRLVKAEIARWSPILKAASPTTQ